MAEAIQLLIATVVLRPYVFIFLAFYLTAVSVALRGNRWFLGEIYAYLEPGLYFGIPLTNFLGWAVVGFVTIVLFQQIDRALATESPVDRGAIPILCGVGLYDLILVFSLVMTFIIGEMLLSITGILLYIPITWIAFARYWRWGAARGFVGRGALS
jgi:putative membrane protein